jgi:poly(glycerol-phosphate) alpha-glucosyltransferase
MVAGLGKNSVEAERQDGRTAILAGKSHGAIGYSRELRRKVFLNTRKDSIVHNHGLWMYPGIVARKASAAAGAPLVISAHGMLDAWALRNSALKKRVAGWLFENRNLRQAACLHALCEAEAKSYRDYGLRNPICIIPNGIDVPEIGNQKPESGKQPWAGCVEPGRKVLLYLGRIHPKKGLVNLLRAWAQIQRTEGRGQRAEWILAIAGWDQGGHELELKQLATELAIPWADAGEESRKQKAESTNQKSNFSFSEFQLSAFLPSVVFLGPQFGDAKAACHVNCDAFILPSFSEGLPMVILEAWAYGKPVLMTPQCNLPEGFTANAAIQIEPTVESIVAGLNTLFQSSISDLQSTGSRGRALVAARFNWARCAREMVEVYRWLLGSGAKPKCVV